jgi:isopropylmalate/homocitrate/citramalate synthase
VNAWELAVAAALYVSVSLRFANHDDYGMALAFSAYAVANIGLMMAAK